MEADKDLGSRQSCTSAVTGSIHFWLRIFGFYDFYIFLWEIGISDICIALWTKKKFPTSWNYWGRTNCAEFTLHSLSDSVRNRTSTAIVNDSCKVPLKASTPYRNIRKHGFFRLRLPRLQRVSLSWTWRRASVCAALPCSCRANLQPYHPSLASHAALLIDAVFWVQAKNPLKQCRKNDLRRHWHNLSKNSMTAGLQSAISSAYIPANICRSVPPQTNADIDGR